MSDRVLVTGASGFVGRVLCKRLQTEGNTVIGVTRGAVDVARHAVPQVFEWRQADFNQPANIDWTELLHGTGSIVHLAAQVHVIRKQTKLFGEAYQVVNCESTVRLAQAAAQAKLKRFVFVSSAKASGKLVDNDSPKTPIDDSRSRVSAQEDPYGHSKWEAEKALLGLMKSTDLRLVILRPPLVYGPGVKANFARLLRLAQWRVPFPFAAVRNARSLIYVDNLVDAIMSCRTDLAAVGQTFPVCDTTISTTELFSAISNAIGVSPRLWAVPPQILKSLGKLLRKETEFARMFDSLIVDAQGIKKQLGWVPQVKFEVGLLATVQWFLSEQQQTP